MENPKRIIMLSMGLALVCKVTTFYNFSTVEEVLNNDKISWIK